MAITKYTIISEESISILETSVEAFLVANPTFQATGQSFFISPTVGYSQVVTVGNVGGGGGGTATAANQVLEIAELVLLNAKLTAVSVVPSLSRVTNAGTVIAGAKSVSVYNAGSADGVWLGVAIKQGEQFSYSANGINNTLGAFAYDGTGTELVITTTV